MQGVKQADAIDTRTVFRVYAVMAGVTGVLVCFLGSTAFTRIAGSFIIAAACFAESLTRVDDPVAGRRALGWCAAGHSIVGQFLMHQGRAVWAESVVDWAAFLCGAILLLFIHFWRTTEGERIAPRSPLISLFGGRGASSPERLRSAYEEQIRQAAGQEERNRLARELHDSVKQQVFAIQTSAATAEVRFDTDPDGARQALAEVRGAARDAMTEMEVMLDQLQASPLENAGLIEALKRQCEALGSRTGARVNFGCDELPSSEDLPPGIHQAIFRVAQEALANVAKHARASVVKVYLSAPGGWVRLVVEDDGTGFQQKQIRRGMGIANMRARAKESGGFLDLATKPRG
ncbi:MAG: sensor histidine kinase, partial [Acidobacteriales bacterium]